MTSAAYQGFPCRSPGWHPHPTLQSEGFYPFSPASLRTQPEGTRPNAGPLLCQAQPCSPHPFLPRPLWSHCSKRCRVGTSGTEPAPHQLPPLVAPTSGVSYTLSTQQPQPGTGTLWPPYPTVTLTGWPHGGATGPRLFHSHECHLSPQRAAPCWAHLCTLVGPGEVGTRLHPSPAPLSCGTGDRRRGFCSEVLPHGKVPHM